MIVVQQEATAMRMRLVPLLAVLLGVVSSALAARILAVFPFPGKSHNIFISSVLKSLAQKGHQIVEYSPFPPAKPIPNHSHHEVHTTFEQEQSKYGTTLCGI